MKLGLLGLKISSEDPCTRFLYQKEIVAECRTQYCMHLAVQWAELQHIQLISTRWAVSIFFRLLELWAPYLMWLTLSWLSLDQKWMEQDKDGMWVLTNWSSCSHRVSSSSKWERGKRKTIQFKVCKCWDMVEYNGINEHIEKTANLIFEDEGTVLPKQWGI